MNGRPHVGTPDAGWAEVGDIDTDLYYNGADESIHLSPDGDWLYRGGERLWRIRVDGSDFEELRFEPGPQTILLRFPGAAHGGDRVSVARYQDGAGDDLQVMELSDLSVASLGVPPHESVWSPDDAWIAYRTPTGRLRRIRPDGTDDQAVLPDDVTIAPRFDWTAAGFLAVVSDQQAFLVDPDTGEAIPLRLPLGAGRRISGVAWFEDPEGEP